MFQVMAKTESKVEIKDSGGENAEEKSFSRSKSEDSLYLQESKWFEQLDRNIVLHLEDHLITDNVQLVYPEV